MGFEMEIDPRNLKANCDTVFSFGFNDVLSPYAPALSLNTVYKRMSGFICDCVQSLVWLLTAAGEIDIDFNDLKTTLKEQGCGLIGIGKGTGMSRAKWAAIMALNNTSIKSKIGISKHALVNIMGNRLSLSECQTIFDCVTKAVPPSTLITLGTSEVEELKDTLEVLIIATDEEKDE
jgi:cell division protein FtsZ